MRKGDVLYVGKAKNIKKRVIAYARPTGHDSRIARMIAATATMEFVTTATETEALLLEANLIKRLRPRFNVLLRDDKSFPYILITSRPLGAADPQASRRAHAARATITGRSPRPARSTAPSMRCSARFCCAPARIRFSRRARGRACCTRSSAARRRARGEIDFAGYRRAGARGATRFSPAAARRCRRSWPARWTRRRRALDFERAAIYRDRLAALSAIQSHQGINPRSVEEADVFAVHQDGGYTCVEVFFFRTGQNWGNRAYFPKADRALGAGEVLERLPGAVLRRQAAAAAAFWCRTSSRSASCWPRRCATKSRTQGRGQRAAARRAQGAGRRTRSPMRARRSARKLADTSSQQKLLDALTETFGLPRAPRRIEVYDNSHIPGTNAVGAMIVAGPEGFRKNQYRKFNIRSAELTPGDDYGMMREVLQRRFKRLLEEARG